MKPVIRNRKTAISKEIKCFDLRGRQKNIKFIFKGCNKKRADESGS